MPVITPTLNATTTPGLMGVVGNNATQQIADQAKIASLQSQINMLAAQIGNPPPNAYLPPTTSNYFMYSGNQNPWTVATKNGSTLVFGNVYNATAVSPGGGNSLPTLVALPWDYTSKSIILCYTLSNASLAWNIANYNNSYCNARRIALDANNAPTIYTSDLSIPSSTYYATFNTGAYGNSYQALISGVAISANQFKSLGWNWCCFYKDNYNTALACDITKYSFNWGGNIFSISMDGYTNNATQSNLLASTWSMTSAQGFTRSSNNNRGMLVNGNGWLSVATFNSDVSIMDCGTTTGASFPQQRLALSPNIHDFMGSGWVVSAYLTTTLTDTANRLTISLQQHDAINGETNCVQYRFSQKTWGSYNSICALSPTQILVQFTDASSVKWCGMLIYTPLTNSLTLYNNTLYNAANLGSQVLGNYGFARFDANNVYGIYKTGTQTASLMRVKFDTSSVGTELSSPTASNINFTLCSGLASVTAVTIMGMIQMAPNVIVIYGIVTAGGVTNCFVDSFTLS